jgi:hypothetical protein
MGWCAGCTPLDFLATKVRRLMGRSLYWFGTDADAAALAAVHGEKNFDAKLRAMQPAHAPREVRFHARAWFFGDGKHVAGRWGMSLFYLQLVSFVAAASIRMWARFPIWAAAVATALIVLLPAAAVARLTLSGALLDLECEHTPPRGPTAASARPPPEPTHTCPPTHP